MHNLRVLAGVLWAVAASLAAVEIALLAVPLDVLRFPPALIDSRHDQIVTTRPPAGDPWVLVLVGSITTAAKSSRCWRSASTSFGT